MSATQRFSESAGSQLADLTRLSMPEAVQAEALATGGRVAEIFWETRLSGDFSWCSSNLGRLLGFGPKETIGRTPRDFMPATDDSRLASRLAAASAEASPIIAFKHQLMLQAGGYCQVESSGWPIFNPAGNPMGYRFVTREAVHSQDFGQESVIKRRYA